MTLAGPWDVRVTCVLVREHKGYDVSQSRRELRPPWRPSIGTPTPPQSRFTTFYVTCTKSTANLDALLQMIINAMESVEFAPANGGTTARELVDRTTRKKLTLKVVEIESTKKYETEKERLSYQALNLEEKVVQLAEILLESTGQPVLIIIDELDVMDDTAGLASFLKAVSSTHLKFMLVGIASSIAELLADHQSIDRSLVPIHLPLMNAKELGQIVSKAETRLADLGTSYTFTRGATTRLVNIAAGFPWFVHVLGQSALMSCVDRDEFLVGENDIHLAVTNVGNNRFAQQYTDMYQNAVRDSVHREIVLRSFAHWTDVDIPVAEVYKRIRRLNINNPSNYKGHLCQKEFGEVLYTPPFQKRGLVRFRNDMFKAYVRLRPSLFSTVDRDVTNVWAQPT